MVVNKIKVSRSKLTSITYQTVHACIITISNKITSCPLHAASLLKVQFFSLLSFVAMKYAASASKITSDTQVCSTYAVPPSTPFSPDVEDAAEKSRPSHTSVSKVASQMSGGGDSENTNDR